MLVMRVLRPLTASLAVLLLLAACGGGPATDVEEGEQVSLTIATGGSAGTYYTYGGAYASILNSQVDDVTANAESTGGSVENVRLVHAGESDLGTVQADVVFDAVQGTGDFEDDPQDIRVVGGIYPNYLQLAVLEGSGIETPADLVGARVSVGPAGGGQEVTLRTVTDALGISFDDFGNVANLGFDDQNLAFGDGQIDVGNYMTSLQAGTISELSSTQDIDFVTFSADEIAQIAEVAPYVFEGVIPADAYDGLEDDVEFVPALWNWLIIHADADEDLVHDLAAALYENRETLVGATPVAEETVPENLSEVDTPVHPGAIRYAEEQGIDLPAEAHGE